MSASTAQILVATDTLSREQWLEYRRKGIGGSDIAGILGMSKWNKPIKIYQDKIGELPPQEENEAMYIGNLLEDIVAREFAKRKGLKVRKRNAILHHPEHHWALGNVDRLIVGRKEGLECKTTTVFKRSEWTEDTVPDDYFIQCQWYMAVTGYKKWHLAVMILGDVSNPWRFHEIERDDELIEQMIQAGQDFWFNHVIPQVPPEFDGSDVAAALLQSMYPESVEDMKMELPNSFQPKLDKYAELKEQLKELEEEKKAIENQIKAEMGENEKAVLNDRQISWKSYGRSSFNSKALAKDHPDIYNKYVKHSSSRRFSIN